VAELAKEAALSRSAFFARFSRAVGVAPIAEIAGCVGHSSASTFGVAFTRHVGRPPTQYAQEHTQALLRGALAA